MSHAIRLLKDRVHKQARQLESHMMLIQQSIARGQQSIDMLTDYVRQYSEKLAYMGQQSAGPEEPFISGLDLRTHNDFANKLMGALKAQVRQNETNKAHLSKAAAELSALLLKEKTLAQLLSKREEAVYLQAVRAEQKGMDELANLRHARAHLEQSNGPLDT